MKTIPALLAGLVLPARLACAAEAGKPALPAPSPAVPAPGLPAKTAPAQPRELAGKVLQTMNAAGYTYVQVDAGKLKFWAAAPKFTVKAGDSVSIREGMPMPDYHSKTLNRDFDLVYFTDSVVVNGQVKTGDSPPSALPQGHPPALPEGHPPMAGVAGPAKADFSGITKPEGGRTIREVYAAKGQLNGKEVKVRGRVVKYNPRILGKNWVRLQDGTGAAGTNELTVTTSAEVKVGDLVLAVGSLATDRDFGAGYKYAVLLENAKVTVE